MQGSTIPSRNTSGLIPERGRTKTLGVRHRPLLSERIPREFMARPPKNRVDYFPHHIAQGRTIFILEEKFGNDGYAFWFKLLEQLGCSDDHIIDTGNSVDLMFLASKTRMSEERAIEILDCLARLEAIDPELWKIRVIWCQKFVDGIADVYRKRQTPTPSRPVRFLQNPSFRHGNPPSTPVSVTETPPLPQFPVQADVGNRQSKVKDSILNTSCSEPVLTNHSEPETAPANSKAIETSPIVTSLPLADKSQHGITETDLVKFRELYPAVHLF